MRKPVVVIAGCDLFLLTAVGFHPPDLHRAAPFRVEVDVLAVGRVVRAVVQTGRCGELLFVPTLDRDGVDVELAVSFAAKGERLAIRRPAMPVGRAGT